MTEQIIENTSVLQQITTFGAGVVALAMIFGIVFFVIKELIPALKTVGETLSKAVESLEVSISILNKTMNEMQKASTASLNSLGLQINRLEVKLDYHVENVSKIEHQVTTLIAGNTEIRERVRNCGNGREPSLRTRQEDLK